MTSLDGLAERASQLVSSSASVEDIERAASVAKMVSEIKKQKSDEATQKLTLKYERWKSLATLLVPLLTVMTLFVTVYIQYLQITVTREANEDTQWREAIKTLASTQSQNFLSDVASTAMLKPFFSSQRYKDQAYDTSFALFGRISSLEGFRDLYNSAFGAAAWSNQLGILRVARITNGQLNRIDEISASLAANPKLLEQAKIPRTLPTSSRVNLQSEFDTLQRAHQEIVNQIGFLTGELISILRSKRQPGNAKDILDLSGVFLLEGDASDVDFSAAKLKDVLFRRVKLNGAKLTPVVDDPGAPPNSSWSGTQWWKASVINADLLKVLIERYYPYNYPDEDFGGLVSNRQEYVADVLRLCGVAKIKCEVSDLKYGEPAPTDAGSVGK